ncbi:MAG: hypothetical protein AAB481_01960 [Patescibacteria group bacterium]
MFRDNINYGANIAGGGIGGVALDKIGQKYTLELIDGSGAVKDGSHGIDFEDLGEGGVVLHGKGGDKSIIVPGERKHLPIDDARQIVTIEGTGEKGVTLDGEPAEEFTKAIAIKRYPRSQFT